MPNWGWVSWRLGGIGNEGPGERGALGTALGVRGRDLSLRRAVWGWILEGRTWSWGKDLGHGGYLGATGGF